MNHHKPMLGLWESRAGQRDTLDDVHPYPSFYDARNIIPPKQLVGDANTVRKATERSATACESETREPAAG